VLLLGVPEAREIVEGVAVASVLESSSSGLVPALGFLLRAAAARFAIASRTSRMLLLFLTTDFPGVFWFQISDLVEPMVKSVN
jgi:hypothetical protein